MATINIDNKEYDTDTLSDEAKAQVNMLVETDKKIAELQRDLAIAQTARHSYYRALGDLLPQFQGDTIKLS